MPFPDNKKELQEKIKKALKRSALKARGIVFQTGTPIVVKVDGEVKHLKVTEEDIQEYRESIKDVF